MRGALRARREGVTLQTQQIHVAHAEKTWISRAVWSMTTRTTFRLYGYMLEYEGTLFVSVALVTDCIATRECPDLAERVLWQSLH